MRSDRFEPSLAHDVLSAGGLASVGLDTTRVPPVRPDRRARARPQGAP